VTPATQIVGGTLGVVGQDRSSRQPSIGLPEAMTRS
jgi:hypothetical protein